MEPSYYFMHWACALIAPDDMAAANSAAEVATQTTESSFTPLRKFAADTLRRRRGRSTAVSISEK
jgi:hypothetical protein